MSKKCLPSYFLCSVFHLAQIKIINNLNNNNIASQIISAVDFEGKQSVISCGFLYRNLDFPVELPEEISCRISRGLPAEFPAECPAKVPQELMKFH